MREPWIAGILSFFLPGVGQIYNGRIVIGILWLVLPDFRGLVRLARSVGLFI
jgi:TM2 domain-containing membrane protein YozV